ncbi:MAG: class I SAM-dependent DNA methyltransferase [Ferruginibacter sp.]
MSLSATIKNIQDILRKDSGLDGDPQRISQLVWMLFLKMFDDTEVSNKTPIPEEHKWRNWTKKNIKDEELISYINKDLFPTLRALPDVKGQVPRAKLIEDIFQNSHNYMTSGSLLKQVIAKIDSEFDFSSSQNRHLFNDIYETILKDIQNSRYSGEFYTPRAVTKFISRFLDPKLGEIILDPACGTGGFLSSAIEYINANKSKTSWTDKEKGNIKGIEKKSLPYMLCITNLMLHDIEVPNVLKDNAFSNPLDSIQESDKVDVILTNPPFGGIEEESIKKEFAKDWSSKETADLFMLLIMNRLKKNGRAGVVLPDGFLFGTGAKIKIKEKLLSEFNLHTIYKLPRGVFAPYTNINSNILFFEKGKPTKEIWYFEHPLPRERNGKPYNKSNPIAENEFAFDWLYNREENPNCWKIDINLIKERNFNLDFKNPNKNNKIRNIESSESLIRQLIQNQETITKIFDQINKELIS